jgi:hypothetical protein
MHDSLIMSCGIFGLGLGTTMITGKTVMRDALGTWNLAKVDVLLNLTTGVLVLIIGSVMGTFNCTQVINRTQIIWNWNENTLGRIITQHYLY